MVSMIQPSGRAPDAATAPSNPSRTGASRWAMHRPLVVLFAVLGLLVSGSVFTVATGASASPDKLPFEVTNNVGRSEQLFLHVVGVDLNSGRLGYVNGGGDFVAWPAGSNPPAPAPDSSIPGAAQGASSTVLVPKNFSGRMYFAYGEKVDFRLTPGGLVQPAPWNPADPNADTLLDWSEFTYNDSGLFLNSSQVDMFAIPHTVSVFDNDGNVRSTGAVKDNGRENVIDGLRNTPGWADTIVDNGDGVLRVLSPGKAAEAGRFDPNYYDGYIDSAWNSYTSRDLVVVPFGDRQEIQFRGRTTGDTMNFTDTSGNQVASFQKPSTSNVWGCDGNLFAPNDLVVGPIARTLCTALVRGTLGTSTQEPVLDDSRFYDNSPVNAYAKIIHENMQDGKAYAFAFDDVGNYESLVTDGNPSAAAIILDPLVGGGAFNPGGNIPVAVAVAVAVAAAVRPVVTRVVRPVVTRVVRPVVTRVVRPVVTRAVRVVHRW